MQKSLNFVLTEDIPYLLCVQCKRVLSQFPVYCYSKGSSCGRCPYPENGKRNEAYEVIAQRLKFPCSHNESGCLENLLPEEVAQHEQNCSFKKYNCPIIALDEPDCEWKGFSRDLLEHFELKHRFFILSECSFEMDFINSHNENYLYPYAEELYIVNLRTDSKVHLYFCTVSYIGHDPHFEKNSYKLILENGNKSSSHEICSKINTTTQISRNFLIDILNNPISIIAKIEVIKLEENSENPNSSEESLEDDEPNRNIDEDLLRELECMVCMEYMVPPIHQCMTGHSICFHCKKSINQCPTCREEFQNTQNFALAKIIQHINYPCKHNNCKFVGKAKGIKQHEDTCIYSPHECPLNDYIQCKDKIQFNDIYEHIVTKHYENFLESDVVFIPFCEEEEYESGDESDEEQRASLLDDCFIIKNGSKLFKLHFQYCKKIFRFAAQLIGPTDESSQYSFEIDVLDTTGNNHRAYMINVCGPVTNRKTAFDNTNMIVIFTLNQIRRLISEQLCFRVRILKN